MKEITRTRFKLSMGASAVVSFIGILATFKALEGIAITALGILGGVVTYYNKKESDSPSIKKSEQ